MTIQELINDLIRRYMLLGYNWQLFSYVITMLLSAALVPLAKRRNLAPWKCIFAVLLIFYMTTVYVATVLARGPVIGDSVRLSLFWSWRKALRGSKYIRRLILENIIMLMPVGFLLPLIDQRTFTAVRTVFIGFIFSMVIETSQYFLKTGLFEADDILHNTVGTLIGYIISKLLIKSLRKIKKALLRNT